ncbi:HAD family hydrolase [Pseudomonas sp. EL_65y_Pfl1_R32]|uniref:HAD family hydrolase n=1 Tax=Pseudomonas sp. EL_65y_Pfl1_R32 TaxID=3088696 RepID=UPI0030DC177D
MISAVVFDAFGTIVRIGQRTSPYVALIREGRRQGVAINPGLTGLAMRTSLSFDELASRLGIVLSPSKREELNRALELELSSIEPYPEAVEAVSRLQNAGIKLGICSNLAAPYGSIVRRLFPEMDGYAFSFELGVMKPNPSIYHCVCNQMEVEPGHCFSADMCRVLMIGDSPRCDRDGPRSVGIMGFHLDRRGQGSIKNLQQFVKLVIAHNRKSTSVS